MSHLDSLVEAGVAKRIWERDTTLWGDAPGIAECLGWLDLPQQTLQRIPQLRRLAEDALNSGRARSAVLGMGGSSMAAITMQRILAPNAPLTVLDTVHPHALADVERSPALEDTTFLVSSKSGTTAEPLSLERHFRNLLGDRPDTARRFIALSDAGTPLARRGADRDQFAAWCETPADVGGRFSALCPFGIVPLLLMGIAPETLWGPLEAMVAGCREEGGANPGLALGAALGNAAREGRDKCTLITSPSLAPFGLWCEQLLAESTGKQGRGVIPITGENLAQADPAQLSHDRHFVYLRLAGDRNAATDALWQRLQADGRGGNLLEMPAPEHLLAEFFRWEFATAVIGHILAINPFDQPDVEAAKDLTRSLLADPRSAALEPSHAALEPLLAELPALVSRHRPSYIALLAYLPPSAPLDRAIAALRSGITATTGLPTLFGYGPRYLHSTGQLLKGGRADVLAIGLADTRRQDPPLSGLGYSLADLLEAQANADLTVMARAGRAVATTRIAPPHAAAIERSIQP